MYKERDPTKCKEYNTMLTASASTYSLLRHQSILPTPQPPPILRHTPQLPQRLINRPTAPLRPLPPHLHIVPRAHIHHHILAVGQPARYVEGRGQRDEEGFGEGGRLEGGGEGQQAVAEFGLGGAEGCKGGG